MGKTVGFGPLNITQRSQDEWVTLGKDSSQPRAHYARAEEVIRGEKTYDINTFPLRNPESFVSGGVHKHVDEWMKILSSGKTDEVLSYIKEGIAVSSYFRHLKGNFKGKAYDSDEPPRQYFPNSSSCKPYASFVKSELLERVKNGSMRVWGKVGECCTLPKIVMPLVVEPSKPRLCHDERYLNLWIKDVPFKLETLKNVHRLISYGVGMVVCDEKSGYDHIKLQDKSQTYFGVQFGGWILTYTTLAFGFKASPYIYSTIGSRATSYMRRLGIRTSQYIDDRMAAEGESCEVLPAGSQNFVPLTGYAVAYCLVEVLTRLGYTLSLKKCHLQTSTCIRFLGFLVDSVRQAYVLPQDKKDKFIALRESILSQNDIELKTLQRFSGKCVSMGLAIPSIRLFCREMNAAISFCQKNSRRIPLSGDLRGEIERLRFLDTWQGAASWCKEYHAKIVLATDASGFKYGVAILSGNDQGSFFSDFWEVGDDRPIHVKEADPVLKALVSMQERVRDKRVDILTDNQAVIKVYENQGGKCRALNIIMKEMFDFVSSHNVYLHLMYVPSKLNAADAPSRQLSLADSTLARPSWLLVESEFGPHTVDLMALDSNVMCDVHGHPLRHLTAGPSPGTAGVNMFSQDISPEGNPYVFPPISMIFPVISLLQEQRVKVCTLVAPVLDSVPIWWPVFTGTFGWVCYAWM